MNGNANSNQYQHISNANSAPYKHPQPDTQTVISQQKQGIPPLLAQVVPDEMDIISVGPGPDGRPVYIVTRELAYGTAEGVIKYLMENSLLSDPDIEAYISIEGTGIDGTLYAVTQFILGGTAGGLIEYFGC